MSTNLKKHLHCISTQLVVRELQSSILFYRDKLGFELDFQQENFYAGLELGPYSIHLKEGTPFALPPQDSDQVNLVIGVTDLDACYASIQENSVDIVQPLREMPYGREFYIADPDGYRIAFFDVT